MNINFRQMLKYPLFSVLLAASLGLANTAPSSTFPIFVEGRLSDERTLTVGDPQNWLQPINNLSGTSATGKIRISPDKFRISNDTFRAIWSGEDKQGDVSIYGASINLASKLNNSSLIFDVKVHTPPSQEVQLGMDCGFPCRGQYNIGSILRSIETERWTALPIPLSCFSGQTFDLSKISGVFLLGTSGSMDVSITNIRIAPTPAGLDECPAASETPAAEAALNPDFFYFVKGELLGSRGILLGDPGKWAMSINGLSGKSASGKIRVEPDNFVGQNDAINISWSKKDMKGELGIYGQPINIAAYRDVAALTFDVKVKTRPKESVLVGMDCGYPCRAEYEIGMLLRKLKPDTWTSFPVPLNCLKSSNFDLSKINGVFLISTSGRLDLSIANIRLERLPEGSTGCK
ncbi:putative glycoside hydrolase [Saccharophagus sp. K07]|uniref:putative glycoside hydrolase n=1 Tax=Saccharophagus sp. K07 TaxID=2283636 RepID=UPI00165203B7|nr:putative glycoside hydrolase [Saccharophagus sp. K07]